VSLKISLPGVDGDPSSTESVSHGDVIIKMDVGLTILTVMIPMFALLTGVILYSDVSIKILSILARTSVMKALVILKPVLSTPTKTATMTTLVLPITAMKATVVLIHLFLAMTDLLALLNLAILKKVANTKMLTVTTQTYVLGITATGILDVPTTQWTVTILTLVLTTLVILPRLVVTLLSFAKTITLVPLIVVALLTDVRLLL